MQLLLSLYLFSDDAYFMQFEENRESLASKLKHNGILHNKTINFGDNYKICHSMTSSLSKIKSIEKIVDVEHKSLGQDLRMLILTDYIKGEFLEQNLNQKDSVTTMGVLPVFELLRRTYSDSLKLGVLTGSVIIIPDSSFPKLKEQLQILGIDIGAISYVPLSNDSNYLLLKLTEKFKSVFVHAITRIFEMGEIQVIVGTKSLLGEGWDAPAINSLILASFVGSYVLSNQMRGRAIRIDKNNAEKTANIWHLCCVDASSSDGGEDLNLLRRRFKMFAGVSYSGLPVVENGINRLCFPMKYTKTDIDIYNSCICDLSINRKNLRDRWNEALQKGSVLQNCMEVPYRSKRGLKKDKILCIKKTIQNFVIVLISSVPAFLFDVMEFFKNWGSDLKEYFFKVTVLSFCAVFLFFLRKMTICIKLLLFYRDISVDLNKIAMALLETLSFMNVLKTDQSLLSVKTSSNGEGFSFCSLKGATNIEQTIFLNCIREIVECIDNPRYLIVRKSKTLLQKDDYHAVPKIIGQNKKYAEYFEKQWNDKVGSCKLIYVRLPENRKYFLQAKMHSLSSYLNKKTDEKHIWE